MCLDCGRTVRLAGVVTQVRCDCKGERSPWMQLIEANPKIPPHYDTTCPPEEQEPSSADARATTPENRGDLVNSREAAEPSSEEPLGEPAGEIGLGPATSSGETRVEQRGEDRPAQPSPAQLSEDADHQSSS